MAIPRIESTLPAGLEASWQLFTDFQHAAEHLSGVTSVELLQEAPAGGLGVGYRFKATRRMGKREHAGELEVTLFDAPRELCIESNSCGGRFKTRFQFDGQGESTRLRVDLSFKPRTLLAKICTPLKGVLLGVCIKAMTADIEELRARLAVR